MAKRWPTCSLVTSPNWRAPTLSKRKFTTGGPVCWSKLVPASVSRSPDTITRRCTTMGRRIWRGFLLLLLRQQFVADGHDAFRPPDRPPHRPAGTSSWRSCQGWSIRLIRDSDRPGTCTRMRSSPWRSMVGLARAQLVDAAAHHFDRLVHHLLVGQGLEGVGHVQGEDAKARLGHVVFLAAHRQHRTGPIGGIEVGNQLLFKASP